MLRVEVCNTQALGSRGTVVPCPPAQDKWSEGALSSHNRSTDLYSWQPPVFGWMTQLHGLGSAREGPWPHGDRHYSARLSYRLSPSPGQICIPIFIYPTSGRSQRGPQGRLEAWGGPACPRASHSHVGRRWPCWQLNSTHSRLLESGIQPNSQPPTSSHRNLVKGNKLKRSPESP